MPTRFYLPGVVIAPPISPAYLNWYSGGNAPSRTMLLGSKIGAADSAAAVALSAGAQNVTKVTRQFVSEPLAAQTISGTATLYIRATRSSSNMTARAQLRVVDSTGASRGVLVPITSRGTPPATLTNGPSFAAVTMTDVVCSAGDRLVLELGLDVPAGGSGGTTVTYGYGTDAASDLPQDTTTTAALNPWLELSGAVTFASPANQYVGTGTGAHEVDTAYPGSYPQAVGGGHVSEVDTARGGAGYTLPRVRSHTSSSAASGSTSVTVDTPDLDRLTVAGDLLLVALSDGGTSTTNMSTQAGWTLVASAAGGALLAKRTTGAEAATLTFTKTGTTGVFVAHVVRVSDVGDLTPVGAGAASSGSTSISSPATLVPADGIVLDLLNIHDSASTNNVTTPATANKLYEDTTAGAAPRRVAAGFRGASKAVSLAGQTWAYPSTIQWRAFAVALAPAWATQTSFDARVVANSPAVFYKGDESSGTSAADSSGHSLPATIAGAPTLDVAAPFQKHFGSSGAIDYTAAASKYLSRANDASLNTSSFSVLAVFQPDTLTTNFRAIVSKDNTASGTRGWALYLNSSSKLVVSDQTVTLTSTTTLQPATDYDAMVTYDGATLKLFLNGVLEASVANTTWATAGNTRAYELVVGAWHAASAGYSFPFDGRIGRVALFPSALSDAEVATIHGKLADTQQPLLAGTAHETDTARAGTTQQAQVSAGGTSHETDTPRAGAVVSGALSLAGGHTSETDTARAGTTLGTLAVAGSTVHEVDTGRAGTTTATLAVAGGTVHETDTAHLGTLLASGAPQNVGGGTVHETDTAQAGTLTVTLLGGHASEVDTPRSGTVVLSGVYLGGTAHEVDTVLAGIAAVATGTAHEVDTAHGGTIVLLRAVTSNRFGGRSRGGLGQAEWFPEPTVTPSAFVRVVAQAIANVAVDPASGDVTYDVTEAELPEQLDQIIVGGKDITEWRDVRTPVPNYSLVSPGGYGPGSLTVPQVAVPFETPGEGALAFLRVGAPVTVRRVDRDTGEVTIDYLGFIAEHAEDGPVFSATLAGDLVGRSALLEQQVPLVRWRVDLGRIAYDAVRKTTRRLEPYLGPHTGIKVMRFGGMGHLEYLTQITAMGFTRTGKQWTIMPDWSGGRPRTYRMRRKDTTTITGTFYADDANVVASTQRAIAEEPNRIFMTGVTPAGLRVRFGRYPGLMSTTPAPYPYADHRSFGLGTQDEDTDTGDGITVLANRLFIVKALLRVDIPGGYDDDMVRAVRDLQRRAGLPRTGVMTYQLWRMLWDVGTVGYSLLSTGIGPAWEDDRVRAWDRTPSGALVRRNPLHDPRVIPVERNIDAGTGFTIGQLRDFAAAEGEEAATPNYVGKVTFPTGALIRGTHTPGTPITAGDVLRARDLRPGDNLVHAMKGYTVHVAGIDVSDEVVSVDIDTRARDTAPLWEVIARTRESRKSLHHAWAEQNRSSTTTKDATNPWDEVGGYLPDPVEVPGHEWVVFPLVAGQVGTISELDWLTDPAAEYVLAIFGRRIRAAHLQHRIGDPLTVAGSRRWTKEKTRDKLRRRYDLLYVAGSVTRPCGYWPKKKGGTNDDGAAGAAPLTGRWKDEAQFSYFTGEEPVLWVAQYADRATTVPRGQRAYSQLEAGT